MKTLALRARVFIHCFLVFGYPGETLALVVHILLLSHPGYGFPVHHGQVNGVIQVIRGHPFWAGTVTIRYETVDIILST